MSTPLWTLTQAIVTALTTDEALSNVITGVYNTLAPGSSKPYIVIARPFATPLDGFRNTAAFEGRTVIHGWARDPAEAIDLYGHVHRILHRKIIQMPDDSVHMGGSCRLVDIVLDEDNVSYQAIVEYTWGVR